MIQASLHSSENVAIWAGGWDAPKIGILCGGNGPTYDLTPAQYTAISKKDGNGLYQENLALVLSVEILAAS